MAILPGARWSGFEKGKQFMFGKDTKVTVRGAAYDLVPLTEDEIARDVLVRLKQGSTVRRIVAIDRGDAILRGVRSDNVLEAVPLPILIERWELMRPVSGQ